MNKFLLKIKPSHINKSFYSLISKNKYRRLSQPGLSRYTVDGLGTEHPDYAVKYFLYYIS